MWGDKIIEDNATTFRQPSSYQIKPRAKLPCKNPLTPHILMQVYQI